jgi:hypothetical protein
LDQITGQPGKQGLNFSWVPPLSTMAKLNLLAAIFSVKTHFHRYSKFLKHHILYILHSNNRSLSAISFSKQALPT